MAKDIAALTAVSQNLMHENLTIADGVYGILSDADVKRQIANLGNGAGSGGNLDSARLLALIEQLHQIISKKGASD